MVFLPKTHSYHLTMRKTLSKSHLRDIRQIANQHSFKLSRSSKTRKIWETVTSKKILNRHHYWMQCGVMNIILEQKKNICYKLRTLLCQHYLAIWSRLWFFQWSCMDVRVALWRNLRAEELMLLNCGVGEDSSESLGQQGDPTRPSWERSVLGVHWKDWCWSWNSNTLATSCEELTHWKGPWCWERLGAGGEGDDRGWDGWMASLTRWAWVWVNSGSWWRTEDWCAAIHGVAKSWTRLSDWTELKEIRHQWETSPSLFTSKEIRINDGL